MSDSNRRAKYYRLTAAGRRQLRAKIAHWTRFGEAVFRIVRAEAPASS
jgi:DNA-binding PadR family transcriptional regulator